MPVETFALSSMSRLSISKNNMWRFSVTLKQLISKSPCSVFTSHLNLGFSCTFDELKLFKMMSSMLSKNFIHTLLDRSGQSLWQGWLPSTKSFLITRWTVLVLRVKYSNGSDSFSSTGFKPSLSKKKNPHLGLISLNCHNHNVLRQIFCIIYINDQLDVFLNLRIFVDDTKFICHIWGVIAHMLLQGDLKNVVACVKSSTTS